MVDVGYAEEHPRGSEAKAAATFAVEFVPTTRAPAEIVVRGPCPRCAHPMTHPQPLLIVEGIEAIDEATASGMWDVAERQGHPIPETWDFTVICGCHVTHANAPEGAAGCGGFWNMRATR
jgi:hypothetical protein